MKISIVTISFNQVRFLRACIDSVLSQAGIDLEYIVVDPGSTDGSREIIESYGDRLIKVFEPDKGAADGLNKGFARASGQIFGFLNSDDLLLPNALRAVVSLFETGSHDAVCGPGFITDERGVALRRVVPSRFSPWLYVHGGVSVFQQGTFFTSAAFQRAGGFNPDNRTCWDGELFLDMALAGARFRTIGRDLAKFRLHGDSITGSGRLTALYQKDCDRIFRKVYGRLPNVWDRLLTPVARGMKFVVDPAYGARRLAKWVPTC